MDAGKKMLVIDDEPAIREGARRILESQSFQVETFANGQAAIERVKEESFDLVIKDLKMPGVSGMDVLKSIKEIQPDLPVISVLITGESATGKELVARTIHKHSKRKNFPFVAVDCTSLVKNLLESELFGHVKGSFAGAIHTKTGLFKVAESGTLFLDEVSNLSLTTQAKLLCVLQERQVTTIGGTQPASINDRDEIK